MKKDIDWFEKRMKDIPKPIVVGKADLTEEEIKKGEEDLQEFIKKSTKSKK